MGLTHQLAKFSFRADIFPGNPGTCGTCGKQVVAPAVILIRRRFSEAPIRKQAKVSILAKIQAGLWATEGVMKELPGSGSIPLSAGSRPDSSTIHSIEQEE